MAAVKAAFFYKGILMTRNEFETLFTPILERTGYDLADLKISSQNKKLLIQVFIDHLNAETADANGGINFDDCEKVSAVLGDFLDNEIPGLDGYMLEISSPGIDRILKKEKDFNRFAGSEVKIKLKSPVEGTKVFYGGIIRCENGVLYITGSQHFNLSDIAEARLHYSDEEIFKKNRGQ